MENLLNKGDVIKTSLSDSTMVLKVEEDKAILFTGNQFVVAHGVQKKNDHVFWNQGDYYDELPDGIFERDLQKEIQEQNQGEGKNFSYETFCKYVKNKMSFIYQGNEGQYEMLQDTEALQGITFEKIGLQSEEKTLKYIYENNLFEEVEKTILTQNIPYSFYEKILRYFQGEQRRFDNVYDLKNMLSGNTKELKYELLQNHTKEIIDENGEEITLYRIRALRKIGDWISRLNYGGYVQSEENLSHSGNCWIEDNAMVYGNAKVSGNAIVSGGTKIYGNAKVTDNANIYGFENNGPTICENAIVSGNATIKGRADDTMIYGNAKVTDNAEVRGAKIYGNARICDEAKISHDSEVYGNAVIRGNAELIYGPKISSGTCYSYDPQAPLSESIIEHQEDLEDEDDWELEP